MQDIKLRRTSSYRHGHQEGKKPIIGFYDFYIVLSEEDTTTGVVITKRNAEVYLVVFCFEWICLNHKY